MRQNALSLQIRYHPQRMFWSQTGLPMPIRETEILLLKAGEGFARWLSHRGMWKGCYANRPSRSYVFAVLHRWQDRADATDPALEACWD